MRKFIQTGISFLLCTLMTVGSVSMVWADEVQTDSTTSVQTTTAESSATTEEVKEQTTTQNKKETSRKKKISKTKKEKNRKISKQKSVEKKEKGEKKDTEKIIPKVYNDQSLEMKNHKEYMNGFVYFNQADEAWNENGYKIHSSGCGPTAMAVCISSLTSKWVTPLDTTIWAYENGYYSDEGAAHEIVPALAQEYKLKCSGLGTDVSKIRKALQAKHPVVALMGPGYFTKKGHFIVLIGIDEKDQVIVADVGSRQRCNYKYPLKDVVGQAKAASAGGPFWEISKPEKKKKKIVEKKRSKEFEAMYNDMKSVLQKNYQLVVPMKKGTLVKEDQFVTIDSLDINDKVIMMDSHNILAVDVKLETVVEEVKKEAVKGSFWETVTIEPNQMNMNK